MHPFLKKKEIYHIIFLRLYIGNHWNPSEILDDSQFLDIRREYFEQLNDRD